MSVAVHLWAERKHGGVKFLQHVQLTDKHFQDIVDFTGPRSKWNLLKDRSILQYKNMWRNGNRKEMKGNHSYRGHHETGFETELKVHNTCIPFCPFEHCKPGIMSPFDLDLAILTPPQKPTPINADASTKSKRRLFTPEKDQEKYKAYIAAEIEAIQILPDQEKTQMQDLCKLSPK